jgi:hypothetical protein
MKKSQKIIRKVLIRQKDLKTLRYKALVKSDYGNHNLYDYCEWCPITDKDILIYAIKNSHDKDYLDRLLFNQNELWNYKYKDWDIDIVGRIVCICPKSGPSYYDPLGFALLTKVK